MSSAILVTGATGATGRATVHELRSRGLKVRALVHKIDSRSEHLSKLGAEVVEGDLLDFLSVRSALEGMQRRWLIESVRASFQPTPMPDGRPAIFPRMPGDNFAKAER